MLAITNLWWPGILILIGLMGVLVKPPMLEKPQRGEAEYPYQDKVR